jgi:hypothetical protein
MIAGRSGGSVGGTNEGANGMTCAWGAMMLDAAAALKRGLP